VMMMMMWSVYIGEALERMQIFILAKGKKSRFLALSVLYF